MPGKGHHEMAGVEGGAAGTRYSSSPDLSSPPRSLSDPGSPAAQISNESRYGQNSTTEAKRGVEAPPTTGATTRKKAGRKPGPAAAAKLKAAAESSAANTDPPKPKRQRKTREPNAAPVQRKKRSLAVEEPAQIIQKNSSPAATRQPKITEMNVRLNDNNNNTSDNTLSPQMGKIEDIPRAANSFFNSAPPPPQPQQQPQLQPQPQQAPPPPQQPQQQQQQQAHQPAPVRTSGQNYDPIRSINEPVRETVIHHNPYNTSQLSPKPTANRASASPSISSLVDPPNQPMASPSLAAQSFFKMQNYDGPTSVPPSPTANRLLQSPMMNTIIPTPVAQVARIEKQPEPFVRQSPHPTPTFAPATIPTPVVKKASPMAAPSSATVSAAASPKPVKQIDITPPPLPGSGSLMLNGPRDGTESRAPTIVLHIPMNGETNKYINFTRLAEEQYGWEALHPRLAAQRERLARVAAAGAALERIGSNKESGDEMSLDMSEGEGSNVEMGGMSDGRTGTDGGAKKPVKKRKTKEDEYDKDDGFVDDSEMLWEEQAAASKDGFFVYSGPLVPEGEKPQLHKPEEKIKRPRGGGKGSRGGSTRGTSSTRGGGTGGGPGSRGGSTVRKPRITKADKSKLESEKAEREKMGALAGKSGNYVMSLASAASMGGTPMVFN